MMRRTCNKRTKTVTDQKTHFRKAFDSPYLSSADIVGPTPLTIARVTLEPDHTKKTRDQFNTAHFAEKELRPGEKLKPMILNATNSKMMRNIVGSPFIDDWQNVAVTVYVDPNVRFGRECVEGLRIAKSDSGNVSWLDAVEGCATEDELSACKREMVKAYKGVNNVPAGLKTACQNKLASLSKAS